MGSQPDNTGRLHLINVLIRFLSARVVEVRQQLLLAPGDGHREPIPILLHDVCGVLFRALSLHTIKHPARTHILLRKFHQIALITVMLRGVGLRRLDSRCDR